MDALLEFLEVDRFSIVDVSFYLCGVALARFASRVHRIDSDTRTGWSWKDER